MQQYFVVSKLTVRCSTGSSVWCSTLSLLLLYSILTRNFQIIIMISWWWNYWGWHSRSALLVIALVQMPKRNVVLVFFRMRTDRSRFQLRRVDRKLLVDERRRHGRIVMHQFRRQRFRSPIHRSILIQISIDFQEALSGLMINGAAAIVLVRLVGRKLGPSVICNGKCICRYVFSASKYERGCILNVIDYNVDKFMSFGLSWAIVTFQPYLLLLLNSQYSSSPSSWRTRVNEILLLTAKYSFHFFFIYCQRESEPPTNHLVLISSLNSH